LKLTAPGIMRLGGAGNGTLLQAARSLGSQPQPYDQWLVRITNMAALLTRLAPLFERRLADSDCSGLTTALRINLFREAFVLRFESGRLLGVDAPGFVDASMGADGGDLCIPRDAFLRLLLGYRTLDNLRDAWPDIVVRPGSRHILDVLFPLLSSCVWMPY
jgi:hypothetical protein